MFLLLYSYLWAILSQKSIKEKVRSIRKCLMSVVCMVLQRMIQHACNLYCTTVPWRDIQFRACRWSRRLKPENWKLTILLKIERHTILGLLSTNSILILLKPFDLASNNRNSSKCILSFDTNHDNLLTYRESSSKASAHTTVTLAGCIFLVPNSAYYELWWWKLFYCVQRCNTVVPAVVSNNWKNNNCEFIAQRVE